MSCLAWWLFPETHMQICWKEKKCCNTLANWEQVERHPHACISEELWPLHVFHDTHFEKKNAPKRKKKKRSCSPCGWIRRKGCRKHVHILGCFSVWFLCLSAAKKEKLGKNEKFSEVGMVWFTWPSLQAVTFHVHTAMIHSKLYQQTKKSQMQQVKDLPVIKVKAFFIEIMSVSWASFWLKGATGAPTPCARCPRLRTMHDRLHSSADQEAAGGQIVLSHVSEVARTPPVRWSGEFQKHATDLSFLNGVLFAVTFETPVF